MLVLSRRAEESIEIRCPGGEVVRLKVCEVRGLKVRLGFEASEAVRIMRTEVARRMEQEGDDA